jgi:hypothetical protein
MPALGRELVLERIESSKFSGDQKINDHNDNGAHCHGGSQGNVSAGALIGVHGLSDKEF